MKKTLLLLCLLLVATNFSAQPMQKTRYGRYLLKVIDEMKEDMTSDTFSKIKTLCYDNRGRKVNRTSKVS